MKPVKVFSPYWTRLGQFLWISHIWEPFCERKKTSQSTETCFIIKNENIWQYLLDPLTAIYLFRPRKHLPNKTHSSLKCHKKLLVLMQPTADSQRQATRISWTNVFNCKRTDSLIFHHQHLSFPPFIKENGCAFLSVIFINAHCVSPYVH